MLNMASWGLQSSLANMNASARRMAGAPTASLAVEIINQISSLRSFEANAAVIKVADETMGTLLDEIA